MPSPSNGVRDIPFLGEESMPEHPNAMRFTAFDTDGRALVERCYFSVGGGFVVEGGAASRRGAGGGAGVALAFGTGDELMAQARTSGLSVAQLMMANECAWRPEAEVRAGLLRIWAVMQQCVQRGFGVGNALAASPLPGPLRMRRRAPELQARTCRAPGGARSARGHRLGQCLGHGGERGKRGGGRVVTAPTNGAAGVVPAVMHYYARFVPAANDDGIVDFLLTAGAIAMLYKANASISGAEVGCQGEVGVACSMAAGALAAVLGGTVAQVENAAEIGMEHNLGLTCDPVGAWCRYRASSATRWAR